MKVGVDGHRAARRRWLARLAMGAMSSGLGCGGDDGTDVVAAPFTCRAPPRPAPTGPVRVEDAYPGVDVDDAVALVQPPGDPSRWYVVAQSGQVWGFDDRPDASPEPYLDVSDVVEHDGEAGLLDLAFHPGFPATSRLFLSYDALADGQLVSRLSRFETSADGRSVDESSEEVLLQLDQPYSNHNGGEIAFGPDGRLYFGLGDGGSGGDPQGNAQNTDSLLGKVLRLDVDAARPYTIPSDNPFAGGGGRPEIFALGFRNPWRFGFDRATGNLWLGDVGQHEWEEVDRVVLGGNYGWNVMEGTDCFSADTCDASRFVPPVAQYRNTGGASVIGGTVYRGATIPTIEGTYVFSDFFFGTIFGISVSGGALQEIGAGAGGVTAWAESAAGELFGVRYRGGVVRLAPADAVATDTFPRLLSETSCVDMADPRRAAPSTEAYEVNVPFFSDGADKVRSLLRGPGEIAVGESGDWDLPPESVLVKTFFREERPIETRLLVRHADGGWAGYGYAWRADGTDADYVERTREEGVARLPWVFPGSRECGSCHTEVAGGSLGLTTGQLDVGDQLARLVEGGVLAAEPEGEPLPVLDGSGSLEVRARAYLDVNCAMCHQPDGPAGRTSMDLRFETPLAGAGLCGASPRGGDLGVAGAAIVTPGDPARSILSVRLRSTGFAHMPPLGVASVDAEGADLVDAWIAELSACP